MDHCEDLYNQEQYDIAEDDLTEGGGGGGGTGGDAAVGDVLAAKTFTNNSGPQTGTMPNVGTENFTPSNVDQSISEGYHNALGKVYGDADLIAANIAAGVNLFGIAGVYKTPLTGDAIVTDVKSGKKFYKDDAATQLSGTMPTVALDPASSAYPSGYHAGAANLQAIEADLVTGNIKAGITIFGVDGKTEVVDTTSGDAVAADMRTTKKAWVDGIEITGNVPNGGYLTGNNLVIPIPDGIYTGSKTATASDVNFVSTNIKKGITVFSVTGDDSVVETDDANATADDIVAPKTAYVNGAKLTGTIAAKDSFSGSEDQLVIPVPAGVYGSGKTATAVDSHLVTTNIKSGASIFGVSGDASVVETDDANAVAGDMLSGKTGYVNGSKVTGNVGAGSNVNGADGDKVITIPDGLYTGSKTCTANDTDLVTGNIKAGVTILGVSGKTEVVDTTSGDAVAADMRTGKKAWVDGVEITGNVAEGDNISGSDGTKVISIPAGIYAAGKTCTANDADLINTNIKNGVVIFGVTGNLVASGGADFLVNQVFQMYA